MKIDKKEYFEECHKWVKTGCRGCKFYETKWDDPTKEVDTWCKITNALSYDQIVKLDREKENYWKGYRK